MCVPASSSAGSPWTKAACGGDGVVGWRWQLRPVWTGINQKSFLGVRPRRFTMGTNTVCHNALPASVTMKNLIPSWVLNPWPFWHLIQWLRSVSFTLYSLVLGDTLSCKIVLVNRDHLEIILTGYLLYTFWCITFIISFNSQENPLIWLLKWSPVYGLENSEKLDSLPNLTHLGSCRTRIQSWSIWFQMLFLAYTAQLSVLVNSEVRELEETTK